MEELEDEALRTGNWEAVEYREKMMARRAEGAPNCPSGQTQVCVESGQNIDCTCVTRRR